MPAVLVTGGTLSSVEWHWDREGAGLVVGGGRGS